MPRPILFATACVSEREEEGLNCWKRLWEAYIICVITTMTTSLTSTIIITTALTTTTTIIIIVQSSVHLHINSGT